jgi:hypothetical protein
MRESGTGSLFRELFLRRESQSAPTGHGRCALLEDEGVPVFSWGRLGRSGEVSEGERSQSRYRIWSVQNRSRRCSDLFSVENSSFEMPPTCSTVLTCFW